MRKSDSPEQQRVYQIKIYPLLLVSGILLFMLASHKKCQLATGHNFLVGY